MLRKNRLRAEDFSCLDTRFCRAWPRGKWIAILLFSLALTRLSLGVILFGKGDPAHNTTAPTGALTNSGWQFQGAWGAYLGTPIASNFFITAAHVGGNVGDLFHFQGVDYPAVASFSDPDSDLRVWRICGAFPEYAPLYSQNNESGKTVVVFGRGTQRGAEVIGTNLLSPELKGWEWGIADTVQRWGTNVVTSIVNAGAAGALLKCNFDANVGDDEAHLSVGDSGGGVFINEDGTWKLAGINYAIDGPFNTSTNGPGFFGAIFDEGGLYQGGERNWTLTPDLPVDLPSAFYATRVSSHVAWIISALQSSLPGLLSATDVVGLYVDTPEAVVDTNNKTVTVPVPSTPHFYRLRACDPSQITGIVVSGATLVIGYQ